MRHTGLLLVYIIGPKGGGPFFRPECSLSAEDLRPKKLVHMLRLGRETAVDGFNIP